MRGAAHAVARRVSPVRGEADGPATCGLWKNQLAPREHLLLGCKNTRTTRHGFSTPNPRSVLKRHGRTGETHRATLIPGVSRSTQ